MTLAATLCTRQVAEEFVLEKRVYLCTDQRLWQILWLVQLLVTTIQLLLGEPLATSDSKHRATIKI